jgi:hypothetical protein
LATSRTALDTTNKTVSDRFGRFVQNLERVERDQSLSATKIERTPQESQRGVSICALSPRPHRNESRHCYFVEMVRYSQAIELGSYAYCN